MSALEWWYVKYPKAMQSLRRYYREQRRQWDYLIEHGGEG